MFRKKNSKGSGKKTFISLGLGRYKDFFTLEKLYSWVEQIVISLSDKGNKCIICHNHPFWQIQVAFPVSHVCFYRTPTELLQKMIKKNLLLSSRSFQKVSIFVNEC